jgi:hypothetical protein
MDTQLLFAAEGTAGGAKIATEPPVVSALEQIATVVAAQVDEVEDFIGDDGGQYFNIFLKNEGKNPSPVSKIGTVVIANVNDLVNTTMKTLTDKRNAGEKAAFLNITTTINRNRVSIRFITWKGNGYAVGAGRTRHKVTNPLGSIQTMESTAKTPEERATEPAQIEIPGL